jgi:hypothetical protein
MELLDQLLYGKKIGQSFCLALTNKSPETSLAKVFIQQRVRMKLSV